VQKNCLSTIRDGHTEKKRHDHEAVRDNPEGGKTSTLSASLTKGEYVVECRDRIVLRKNQKKTPAFNEELEVPPDTGKTEYPCWRVAVGEGDMVRCSNTMQQGGVKEKKTGGKNVSPTRSKT